MSGKLTLYAGGVGFCSLASHIALEEAGADYTVTRIDGSKGEQRSAEYLKVNPKGRVPALGTPQGIITETPAILYFIAQTHPKARLAPTDPFALARVQDFNSYLCSTVHPNHAHRHRGSRWSDDPAVIEGLKVKVTQNVRENFQLIERDYFKGPWLMGEDYCIADPYLFTLCTWMPDDGLSISDFPKLADHHARMQARPAVKKVLDFYA